MSEHKWTKSTLGHGDAMCAKCLITNREAAVLGQLNVCFAPTPPSNERLKNDADGLTSDLIAALEPFAEFARMMDEIEHVQKTPDDAVIHPGLTVGHFRKAREVLSKATPAP